MMIVQVMMVQMMMVNDGAHSESMEDDAMDVDAATCRDRRCKSQNKAVYTEGLAACCWALAVSLLIVFIAQIVLSACFGTQQPTIRPTDQLTNCPTKRLIELRARN